MYMTHMYVCRMISAITVLVMKTGGYAARELCTFSAE